jgi:ADP-ribose pyrophosphatase YjhB (NUDIX family)
VACAVLHNGQEYLIVRPRDVAGAKWAFLGAPVEEGESVEIACRRVCRDALGADVAIDYGQPPIGGEYGGRAAMYRYSFCYIESESIRSDGPLETRWVLLPQLREYEFDPPHQGVADWLVENE